MPNRYSIVLELHAETLEAANNQRAMLKATYPEGEVQVTLWDRSNLLVGVIAEPAEPEPKVALLQPLHRAILPWLGAVKLAETDSPGCRCSRPGCRGTCTSERWSVCRWLGCNGRPLRHGFCADHSCQGHHSGPVAGGVWSCSSVSGCGLGGCPSRSAEGV